MLNNMTIKINNNNVFNKARRSNLMYKIQMNYKLERKVGPCRAMLGARATTILTCCFGISAMHRNVLELV